ncbi:vacuolar diacylglycerol pyrophosphate phosphatase [Scheffersomyces amazonensis]|uniref:vacuolar diacylglycerol pyrophosphate phosphatase n=1 Tax=Scheffersomyces amazonensis TaxID=1078765 RepID=UPI00315D26EE
MAQILLNPSVIVDYVKGREFQKFLPDWIVALVLIVYFFIVAEHAKPFERQFSLNDLTISHPFAIHERVSGTLCLLIAFFIPIIVITSYTLYKQTKLTNNNSNNNSNNNNSQEKALHNLQIALLGLVISLSVNGVVTDILKNWIARPRPDFLARCGAAIGTPSDVLVDISVCTAPLGKRILTDGMRSTPSGHSSISFSALLYLSLWLTGQFKLTSKTNSSQPLHKFIIAGLPILLSSYIALSRTQDYRHHFVDIILGGCIGIFFAITSYLRYFPSIYSEDCDRTLDEIESNYSEPLLPR